MSVHDSHLPPRYSSATACDKLVKSLLFIFANLFVSCSFVLADTFYNSTSITISEHPGTAPYPSAIMVSNLVGQVSKVTLTFSNFSHSYPYDLEILLVSPDDKKSVVMAHVGGSTAVSNLTVALDEEALILIPEAPAVLTSGRFRPTYFSLQGNGTYLFLPPAPPSPYDEGLAVFQRTRPNGRWELFITDTDDEDDGVIANGWSSSIETGVFLKVRSLPGELEISWPSDAGDFVLQWSLEPHGGAWNDFDELSTVEMDQKIMRVPPPPGARFYRLRNP